MDYAESKPKRHRVKLHLLFDFRSDIATPCGNSTLTPVLEHRKPGSENRGQSTFFR